MRYALLKPLRRILIELWNPLKLDQNWLSDGGVNEYDTVGLEAVYRLNNGHSLRSIYEFLVEAELQHMGCPERHDTRRRARMTAAALARLPKVRVDAPVSLRNQFWPST